MTDTDGVYGGMLLTSGGDCGIGSWTTTTTSLPKPQGWNENWYYYDPSFTSIKFDELTDNSKKEYDMKGLYDVYLVYAENRDCPATFRKDYVIASSEEDAKIKSGLMKEVNPAWDDDYLTFIVRKIGDIKVKPKPQETKQV